MWMLYVFALLFGLAAAFFDSARPALIPQLVEEEQLQVDNVINVGTAQLGQHRLGVRLCQHAVHHHIHELVRIHTTMPRFRPDQFLVRCLQHRVIVLNQ